jgi:hypothetical protein
MPAAVISDKARDVIEQRIKTFPAAYETATSGYGVAKFSTIHPETGAEDTTLGIACHAGLTYAASKGKIVVNGHGKTWHQVNADFMRWVLRESPFSHGIVNRDNEDEFLKQASVLDTREIGLGGALWTCKALRHFKEDTYKLPYWNQLREQGLNGLQAFIGADILGSTGEPQNYCTHTGLFGYQKPADLRKVYDEFCRLKKIESSKANRGLSYGEQQPPVWGSLKSRQVKKDDGWGGFTMITVPCDPAEYADKLKEIFEGDPKNVK